jgi:hypothetical protein
MARPRKDGRATTHPKYASRGPRPFVTDRARRKRATDLLRDSGANRRTHPIQGALHGKRSSRIVGAALAIGMSCALLAVVSLIPSRQALARCMALGSVFLVSCDAGSHPQGAREAGPLDFLSAPVRN